MHQTVTPGLLARLSPEMREMLGFGSNVKSSLESLYMKPLISSRARH